MNRQTPAAFRATARFTPIACLGQGSMGVVHRVRDSQLGNDVALKTLMASGPDELYRLKREFRSLAGILHPNLVQLYDLVVTAAECFFTMELVDGRSFVDYVRDGAPSGTPLPVTALPRFVEAARQLAHGLAALHAAGTLHLDVKPSNVLVTRDGRLVLLDFGLAATRSLGEWRSDDAWAGTLAYMSPEQMWGGNPTPAADWYAAGVVFYETLAGHLPFPGSPVDALAAKDNGSVPALPEHLRRVEPIVRALLNPRPAQRPCAEDVVRALDACVPLAATAPAEVSSDATKPFVGRAAELAALQSHFAALKSGRGAAVHLQGPSGIGKSETVRRFLREIEGRTDAVVLTGKCHPQEDVPYNAMDAIIDGLSRVLFQRSAEELASLVPDRVASLLRVFPVLARVPGLAVADNAEPASEPVEIRREGFQALRQLLSRLGNMLPLVLWIDDLQWSDADSAALLRELLRPPDAPRMLLILSYRSEDADSRPVQAALRATGETDSASRTMTLGPLAAEETRILARALCHDVDEAQIDIVAAESEGLPFFVNELARHSTVVRRAAEPTGSLAHRLATVLEHRLTRLPDVERNLLAVVSVAGRPLQSGLALRAAGVNDGARPLVFNLEHGHLLRSSGEGGRAAVEVYHDRIRELVLSQLADDERRQHHLRLAQVLESQRDADPLELFAHYLGGGETDPARRYGIEAADRAARTLAFDRAAQLYRQVLDLGASESERPSLLARLGDALANSGRGRDAGDVLEAAAGAAAATGAADRDVINLRRRAAEQYLRTGQLEQGVAVTRAVMAAVGVKFPETQAQALGAAVRGRVRLAWRGLRYVPREQEAISTTALLRLEAFWSAALALSVVDQIAAEALGVRHLLEALDVGDRGHIVRALGWEATKSAALGGNFLRRRSARLLAMVQAAVANRSDPYERAWCHIAAGTSAYENAEWRRAFTDCEEAVRLLRTHCTGVTWEVVTFSTFGLSALAHMGELSALAERLPAALRDADDRGDDYAAIGLRNGVLNLHWLAQDRPADGLAEAAEAMNRWPSNGAFHVQHYLQLIADVQASLYMGTPWPAWRRLNEAWPKLSRALFLRMEGTSVELHNLRGRLALGTLAHRDSADADPAWPRAALLRTAEQEAAALGRYHIASALPFATLLRAGIASAESKADAAAEHLASAVQSFDDAEMGLYAAAARIRLGRLRGGDAGAQLAARGCEWMHRQGVVRADDLAAVFAPMCL